MAQEVSSVAVLTLLLANLLAAQATAQEPIFISPVKAELQIKDRCTKTPDLFGSFALSGDNKRIIMAAPHLISAREEDGELWKKLLLWEISAAKVVGTLAGHSEPIGRLAFSPDGSKVIGVAFQPEAKTQVLVWNLPTGEVAQRFTVEGAPRGLDLAGNILLTSAPPGRLAAYHIGKDCKKVFSAELEHFGATALSPNGKLITAAIRRPKKEVVVWEIATGAVHARFSEDDESGRKSLSYSDLFFSEDGSVLCGRDGIQHACCWDVAGKGLRNSFQRINARALSQDGRYLVGQKVNSDKGLDFFLISTKTGNRVAELLYDEPGWEVTTFRFAPDGRHVLIGSLNGKVRFWDMPKNLPE